MNLKELIDDYKDSLLFCYDNDIINADVFYLKMDWIQKLEKYV